MENMIREKALELGYEDCGIVKACALAGYREKLEERIARIPNGEKIYGNFRRYADPAAENPAIKSIIVAIIPIHRYNLPAGLDGLFGKTYMFDSRKDENAPFFKKRIKLTGFLENLGIKCLFGGEYGLAVPARWAAQCAGLGVIRGNNFFYTENGSYNYIEMFAIDRELELIGNVKLKDCSEKCGKCIESCPTRTLCAPYTMSMPGCMSFQTSVSTQFGMGVPSMEMAEMGGGWLYGCDACQDACPFNKGKWTGGEDFPGISSLAPLMRPEKIMEMSYDEIKDAFCSKYWYIKHENLWKWKLNALMAMMNRYSVRYEAPIRLGLIDSNEEVREFSRKVCSKLGLGVLA